MSKLFKFAWVIFLVLGSSLSLAQSKTSSKNRGEGIFNKLLAPGPLIRGHQSLEHGDCLKCHDAGKGVPDRNCLACHDDIRKSIATRTSFHAKLRQDCISCHSDHKGRNFDSTRVNQKTFNHNLTGFKLSGKHSRILCTKCHVEKKNGSTRFFGTSKSCKSCHTKDDPHKFLGKFAQKECSSCHKSFETWKGAKFNHARETGFPLVGRHAKVSCKSCHVKKGRAIYKFPTLASKTCESCHKSPHQPNAPTSSRLFKTLKCTTCHNYYNWQNVKNGAGGFDHNALTKFKLTGTHLNQKCQDCHVKGEQKLYQFGFETKNFCESCHNNVHKGQFRPKFASQSCDKCHSTANFFQTHFNHNQARFTLTGKHKQIAKNCKKCHTPSRKMLATKPPKRASKFIFKDERNGFCRNCHKDVHQAMRPPQFSKRIKTMDCRSCHNTDHFGELSKFDHNKTRFKIVGAHKKFSKNCVECHKPSRAYLIKNPPKKAHIFTFTGAKDGFCKNCHGDIHKQQFSPKFSSQKCITCHTQIDFHRRKPFNHNQTSFKIDGAHLKIKNQCSKCHTPTRHTLPTKPPKVASKFQFTWESRNFCEACHKNDHHDQFRPKLAKSPCISCHTTQTFSKAPKFKHNKRAKFEIHGKHRQVPCQDCHTKTKKRFSTKPFHFKGKFHFGELKTKDCATCHEDPHKGSFGKQCSSCHTERGWFKTGDFHKNQILRGVHNLLACDQCHVDDRALTGTGNDCILCHQKDDIHFGTQPKCAECHTQMFWNSNKFRHSLTNFPLRGIHRTLNCSECHAGGVYEGLPNDCISCHFQDAANVQSLDHSISGFESCDSCHNQFSFSGARR